MGFFLLGIPLALIGLYTMGKDINFTIKDEAIKNKSVDINKQKDNIDKYFINIIDHCNAKCKIKNGRIYDMKEGEYGGMDIYLSSRGYGKEAIDYCKKKFDDLAKIEHDGYIEELQNRVIDFENKLQSSNTEYTTLTINRHTPKSKIKVEKDVNKIIEYFKSHNNDDIQVNIIMGGTKPHHNHSEIWTIKKPIGFNAVEYYFDVSEILGIRWEHE